VYTDVPSLRTLDPKPLENLSQAAWPAAYRIAFVVTAIFVGAVYGWFAQAANQKLGWSTDSFGYYNYLGQAFASGHLYLPVEPAPELLALPDPWDPERNQPYRAQDLVLYNRRYYLYHGATPALLLFTPWRMATGMDLPEASAALVFAFLGFVFSCGVLLRLLSRIKARPSLPWLVVLLLAMGLCPTIPYLLLRVKVYEVAILGGYFCISAGFWFLTKSILAAKARLAPMILAGTMFGLSIGCRPHFGATALIAAAMLLLFREYRGRLLLAFCLPVIGCLMTIALYNFSSFRDPLEFGMRYEMAAANYFRPALSWKNVEPGLYYLLADPPAVSPVFPFVRLMSRLPFDAAHYPLPVRYFAEPIAGAVPMWPLTLLALAGLVVVRRSADRRVLVVAGTMFLGAVSSIALIAALGLISHRFEMDFLPWFVLVGCWVAGSATGFRFGKSVAGIAILYSVIASLGLGFRGPFDNFLRARPGAYVKLARWFSPVWKYRPLLNPRIAIEAEYSFPEDGASRSFPLISSGHFGSRYLLGAETRAGGLARLISSGAPTSGLEFTAEVTVVSGRSNRVRLDFDPSDRIISVQWNGATVLRHALPFLITAPAQVTVGEDRAEIDSIPIRFPGRVVPISKVIDDRSVR
jgi:hypothetical protein